MHILFTIIVFLILVFILVLVHELGHFCLAKLCGIKVLRFSIGFGKPLWKTCDKQGTEYALAPIPLGGYVKLLDSREVPVPIAELTQAFDQRPLYQRFIVVLAGPLFNVIAAVLAFWIVFTVGITYVKPIVAGVTPQSPAALAGMQPGEQILAIDNRLTRHWAAVSMALVTHYGEKGLLSVTVLEPGPNPQIRQLKLNLQSWHLDVLKPNPISSLGIKPYMLPPKQQWPVHLLQIRKENLLTAFASAWQETYYFSEFNFIVLYKMLIGIISWHSLGGPLSIMQAAVLAAQQGFIVALNFLALLSISIAIINILPIPGLDGAQLIYQLIELIRGRPVSLAVQVLAFRLGLIILVLFMLQVVLNDLQRLG